MQKLCFCAHALLGNQQNHSCQNHDGAEDIEQGGTHATGGGQGGTGGVTDTDGIACLRDGVNLVGNSHCRSLLAINIGRDDFHHNAGLHQVVACGSLGLFQVVDTGVQASDIQGTISIGIQNACIVSG